MKYEYELKTTYWKTVKKLLGSLLILLQTNHVDYLLTF